MPLISLLVNLYSKSWVLHVGNCFNSYLLFIPFMPHSSFFFKSPLPLGWLIFYLVLTHQTDLLGNYIFTLIHFHNFCSEVNLFQSCLFPCIVDDTHIIGPILVIFQAIHHFSSHLNLIGLAIQLCKCATWFPSWFAIKVFTSKFLYAYWGALGFWVFPWDPFFSPLLFSEPWTQMFNT
jgi:hypothetical protein